MRLLIVDDDPSLRVAIQMVCELAGHSVTSVDAVSAAREQLAEHPFDAVLIDAGMSGSGVELWRSLSDRADYEDRAFLMTGNVPGLGTLGRHPHVMDKPFDYDALLERLEGLGSREAS
ncbi:MAG: response regulator [Gemmatimonadota bacterium]